jgi:RNA polymerase sigma factor (TIGR02999 family)
MQPPADLSPSSQFHQVTTPSMPVREVDAPVALDHLVPLVYQHLRDLARNHLRRLPGCLTLNATGLVHEAYLKLARSPDLRLKDQGHLMAVSARAMRQVLVSRARTRHRLKRGGGVRSLELDEAQHPGGRSDAELLLDLDRALGSLRESAPELADIFECRYFGGLGEEETARALEISLRTVQRGWTRGRAWLRASLAGFRREGGAPTATAG